MEKEKFDPLPIPQLIKVGSFFSLIAGVLYLVFTPWSTYLGDAPILEDKGVIVVVGLTVVKIYMAYLCTKGRRAVKFYLFVSVLAYANPNLPKQLIYAESSIQLWLGFILLLDIIGGFLLRSTRALKYYVDLKKYQREQRIAKRSNRKNSRQQ